MFAVKGAFDVVIGAGLRIKKSGWGVIIPPHNPFSLLLKADNINHPSIYYKKDHSIHHDA
jgi:hypothetical protein